MEVRVKITDWDFRDKVYCEDTGYYINQPAFIEFRYKRHSYRMELENWELMGFLGQDMDKALVDLDDNRVGKIS